MVSKWVQRELTSALAARSRLWLGLSLAIVLGWYLPVLHQALSSPYLVQDDARQHLLWMARFSDPDLLPNDQIANYFQAVAPWGFTQFYRLFATIGISPLLLSKLLPLFLALLTTGYCFYLSLEFLPLPIGAFIATTLFNQNFWMRDDLASASPRAFLNLFFLAFLYYLLRRSPWLLAPIGLLGWFYPQYVFIAVILLLLHLWHGSQPRPAAVAPPLHLLLPGLMISLLILLPYAIHTSAYAPTISAAQARALPEFAADGRARFFATDFGRYWLSGGRSGIQPPLDPPLLVLGWLLPVLMRFPGRFPVIQQAKNLWLLGQITIAALVMFFLSHALLFKLHLPSRYTQHSLRIVIAIAAAIVLVALLECLFRWAAANARRRSLAFGLSLLSSLWLLGYPLTLDNFPRTTFVISKAAPVYDFLLQQPKSTIVASLTEEANNLPIFGQRSLLVGSEYAIPYHLGYYRPFRQRVLALLQAQYSPDLATVQAVIQRYKIDFWLLDRPSFTRPYLAENRWLRQYQPAYSEALAQLATNHQPALARALSRCTAVETEAFVLLNAACVTTSGAIAP